MQLNTKIYGLNEQNMGQMEIIGFWVSGGR
jgi:hypothetical protein